MKALRFYQKIWKINFPSKLILHNLFLSKMFVELEVQKKKKNLTLFSDKFLKSFVLKHSSKIIDNFFAVKI